MNKQENTILKEAKHDVTEARSMQEQANDWIALCKSTRSLIISEKVITITVVCDYSQNDKLPSFGNEQPTEVHIWDC